MKGLRLCVPCGFDWPIWVREVRELLSALATKAAQNQRLSVFHMQPHQSSFFSLTTTSRFVAYSTTRLVASQTRLLPFPLDKTQALPRSIRSPTRPY